LRVYSLFTCGRGQKRNDITGDLQDNAPTVIQGKGRQIPLQSALRHSDFDPPQRLHRVLLKTKRLKELLYYRKIFSLVFFFQYIRFYANSARLVVSFHLNFLFHQFLHAYGSVHMCMHAHTVSPNRTEAPNSTVGTCTWNIQRLFNCGVSVLAAFASYSYRRAHKLRLQFFC